MRPVFTDANRKTNETTNKCKSQKSLLILLENKQCKIDQVAK